MIHARAHQLLSERDHASAELRGRERCARRAAPKPFVELRPPSPARYVANGDRDGLLLADEDHEPLAAGDAGVEEVRAGDQILPHGRSIQSSYSLRQFVLVALKLNSL